MTNSVPRNVYCRKRRIAELRELDVVEAGNRHLLGHSNTFFAECPQYPDGHKIIRADDCCGIECAGQHLPGGLPAPLQGVVAGKRTNFGTRSESLESLNQSVAAIGERGELNVVAEPNNPFVMAEHMK